MKKRILSFALSVMLIFAALPPMAFAQGNSETNYGTPGEDYAPGEAIVCVEGGVQGLNGEGKGRSASLYDTEELMTVSEPSRQRSGANTGGKSLVLVKSSQDTETLIAALESNSKVEFAEPNYYVEPYSTSPSDPYYKDQWHLDNKLNAGLKTTRPAYDINAEGAWATMEETNKEAPVVAVLDSGVDYDHPDLKGIMWDKGDTIKALTDMGGGKYGYNAIKSESSNDPMDKEIGHGTHCAGIVAAQWNDKEVAGVAKDAKIMAVRFMGGTSSENTISGAIRGYAYIQAAAENGVNVVAVNNSWGGGTYSARMERSISTAVTALGISQDVVSCFAVGNNNTDMDNNPASIVNSPYAIVVGAMESTGTRSPFSNYGSQTVDVFAPGSQILSTTTTSTATDMNKHTMPIQYLPQLQKAEDSYLYEDFESPDSQVGLRLVDKDGKITEGTKTSPGHSSATGMSLDLSSVNEGDPFKIEISIPKDALKDLKTGEDFYFAFQGAIDNGLYYQPVAVNYQKANGELGYLLSPESSMLAYINTSDYNWTQSSTKISVPDFKDYDNGQNTVVLTLQTPGEGIMQGKVGASSTFRLDDLGIGKTPTNACYANGTSMATPVVAGIAALLSPKTNNGERAAEVIARIKGGVNRESVVGDSSTYDLKGKSVSDGFVDAAKTLNPEECVPVLDSLETSEGTATLKGHFFGTQGSITIGDQSVTPESWTEDTITFKVPQNLEGRQAVIVTPNGKDYGRNYFNLTQYTKGYTNQPVPNFDYGQLNGYSITSANVLPAAMAAAGDKLLYMGYLSEKETMVLNLYDTATKSWTDKLPIPQDLLANQDTDIYSLAGGLTKFYLLYADPKGDALLGVYDPATKSWTSVKTELVGTEKLVVYKDMLLAVGGDKVTNVNEQPTSDAIASVSVLDPTTGKIKSSLPEMPEARSCPKVSASGNYLVVQGGTNGKIKIGNQAKTYTNTMVYNGTSWSLYSDKLLDNPELAPSQTPTFAFTATNISALSVGLVKRGAEGSITSDTWRFNPQENNWNSAADKLYSQYKTTQNVGAVSGGQFYVLSFSGAENQSLIFRSMDVDYTGPTADPIGDNPNPPGPTPNPGPTVNPAPTTVPTDTQTSQNAGTGLFTNATGIGLVTAVLLLLLGTGIVVVYKKYKA